MLVPGVTPDVFFGDRAPPSGPIEIGLSRQRGLAIASIVLLTWINIRGVRTAALLQTILTVIKTSSLALLIIIGFTVGRHAEAVAANFGPAFWPADGLTLSMLPVLGAAMVGSIAAADLWYQIGFAAGEVKNPVRDIPQAMLFGTLIVAALYFFANVAYLNILPAAEIAGAAQDRVGTAALQAVLGPTRLYRMAPANAISCFGCNNAHHCQARASTTPWPAMACSSVGGRAHPRYRTPNVASSHSRCGRACSASPAPTATARVHGVRIAALLCTDCLRAVRAAPSACRSRATGPGHRYPWLPGFFLLFTAALSVNLLIQKPQYTWPGLIIIALGIPMFLLRPRRGSRGRKRRIGRGCTRARPRPTVPTRLLQDSHGVRTIVRICSRNETY